MHEDCEQWKLFCLVVRYYKLTVGIVVFWPYKDLLMNDEVVDRMIVQGHITMDGVNNLTKKQVSCKDNSLLESFEAKNIDGFKNMGNIVEDKCNEKLHGKIVISLRMVWKALMGSLGLIPWTRKEVKRIL